METKYSPFSEQYAIYKGMGGRNGAMQFNYITYDPNRKRDGKPSPKGFLLLEMSKTIDKNVYDWENKLKFAFSVEDIARFLIFKKTGGSIFHEFNGRNSSLEIRLGNKDRDDLPTWMCTLSSWTEDRKDKKSITVPINAIEMTVLTNLFQAAIPGLMGWSRSK